ncbi:MAG TPA: hypothetical protein VIL39_01230, partial [Verrucomicrobiae bacterium]
TDVLTLDLVGQGCVAALPNLCTSEALVAAGRCQRVLSICVEVCSAALYFDDDPGVPVSACLFGDGAGAAVLANSPGGRGGPCSGRPVAVLLDQQNAVSPDTPEEVWTRLGGGPFHIGYTPVIYLALQALLTWLVASR